MLKCYNSLIKDRFCRSTGDYSRPTSPGPLPDLDVMNFTAPLRAMITEEEKRREGGRGEGGRDVRGKPHLGR